MPGVDRASFATSLAESAAALFAHVSAAPAARDEPALACYVTASCAPLRALKVQSARIRAGRLTVRAGVSPKLDGEASVVVRADGMTTTFTVPVRAGVIRIVHSLPDMKSAELRLALVGPKGVGVTRARLLVGARTPHLSVRRAAIRNGILEAGGGIHPSARGRVLLGLRAGTASGRVETLRSRAELRRGKWRAVLDLGSAGPRGGQLTIRYAGQRRGAEVTLSGSQRVVSLR